MKTVETKSEEFVRVLKETLSIPVVKLAIIGWTLVAVCYIILY